VVPAQSRTFLTHKHTHRAKKRAKEGGTPSASPRQRARPRVAAEVKQEPAAGIDGAAVAAMGMPLGFQEGG